MKKGNLLYSKLTIILFIIISIICLFILSIFTSYNMNGAGHSGFPIIFSSWGIGGQGEFHNYFSIINLILDLIIYYIAAVLISLGISKIKR